MTPEQTETVYKCAEGLLKITHIMKDIDDSISYKALQLSDEVLKLIENNEQCDVCQPTHSEKPQEDFLCISHSNVPNTESKESQNIENEVDYLVEKIKKELGK